MPGEDVVLSAEFEPAGTVGEPDKEALNAAIAKAEALNEADYTADSWAAMQEALNNAKSVAADEDADQNAIDAAVQALNAAIEALEEIGEPGDPASDAAIQALRNLIDKANALESDDETLNAAIAAAQALLDDPDSVSASAVVAAMLDLSEAIAELNVEVSSDKLKESLKATIDYINDMILTNVDGVRPGKVQELKTAIAEAYQVYLQSDDANEIKAAISNLCEKAQELWLIVSKAELNALIEAAETISADGYTDLTYRALQAAITAAKSVAKNDDATTSEVTTAITDLANAIAGLESITLDTSALEHEIELVTEMIANLDDYVPSTVEGLADKLAAAQAALEATSQDAIDEATKTLREARLNARTKADISALEELVAYVNSLDLRAYTLDSVVPVNRMMSKLTQAMNDEEITQEKVDELAAEMQAAIDGLQPVSEGSVTTPDAADTAAAAQTGMMLVLLAAAGMAATAVYRRKRS